MKTFSMFCIIFFLVQLKITFGTSRDASTGRCINVWDEGCVNGQLPGAGRDDEYVSGGFNPGKRCINMWDEGCINNQLPGSGSDNEYVNGGFNPGKRCVGENCNKQKFDGGHTSEGNRMLAYILAKLLKTHH